MKIVYFYFNEPRIIYGSAASMALKGHNVCIFEPNEPFSAKSALTCLWKLELTATLRLFRYTCKKCRLGV
jgi:hypothetical protein